MAHLSKVCIHVVYVFLGLTDLIKAILSTIHLAFCGGLVSKAFALVTISLRNRYFGADRSVPSGCDKLSGILVIGYWRAVFRSVLLHSNQPNA